MKLKLALFYDTETTGLPLFREPSEDPRQPHIVQLGACLVDMDTRETLSTLDVIVRPDGWMIPDEVAAIHGITTERAQLVGVSESVALGMLLELWGCADVRIGHNETFDARIIRIAQARHEETEMDAWKSGAAQCTARAAAPIMKLPPTDRMRAAGRTHHKTPTLSEAYRFFTGSELKGAHGALIDVHACRDVFFAIQAGQRDAAALSAV